MRGKKSSKTATDGMISVNGLSELTGVDRNTCKRRLVMAGLLADPVTGAYVKALAIDAVRPPAPTENSSVKDRKLFEEWRKLKIVNDKRDGLLVEKAKVKESISRFNARVDAICSRYENEWPSVLAGLEPPQIRAYLKRGMDQVRAEVSESYKEWIV